MKISAFLGFLSIAIFAQNDVHANIFGDAINKVKDTAGSVTGKHGGKHDDKGGDDLLGLGDMDDLGDMGDLGGGLGLDKIPGMDMLSGGKGGATNNQGSGSTEDKSHHHKKDKDDEKDEKHHGHHKKDKDDEKDEKHHGHHKKDKDDEKDEKHHGNKNNNSNDKSDGGLLGSLGDLGKNAMGAAGNIQKFSDDLNKEMFAAPGKIADGLGKGVDTIVNVEDKVIDATGMGNNIIGQTVKGVDHGVGDSIKQVMTDFATFESLYMKYMMGSGVASVIASSVTKNVKAELHKQNVSPDKATSAQRLTALQTSLKAQNVDDATIQNILNNVTQGMAQQAQGGSTPSPSGAQEGHHGGGHHGGHHNN